MTNKTYDDCELCHGRGRYNQEWNVFYSPLGIIQCPLCAMRARAEQAEQELERVKAERDAAKKSAKAWKRSAKKYRAEMLFRLAELRKHIAWAESRSAEDDMDHLVGELEAANDQDILIAKRKRALLALRQARRAARTAKLWRASARCWVGMYRDGKLTIK